MKTAVLFLIFNRPDTTQRVFEEIRKAKPPRLYISSDGARSSRPGEAVCVEQTRRLVLESIDWPCSVKTLFNDKNLGCKIAISSAITWFFEQEPQGIILEDDCLPNASFFSFCEELLDYYRDNKAVMHISGDQFIPNFENGASYYFAPIEHCWGWATWADRWKNFSYHLDNYDESKILDISKNADVQAYWLNILHKMQRAEINSWAYPWTLNIIERKGLCINPTKNLISNIGFGSSATHTLDKNNSYANLPTYNLTNIIHPSQIKIDTEAAEYIFKYHFNIGTNTSNTSNNERPSMLQKARARIKKYKTKLKNLFRKKKNPPPSIFEQYHLKKRFVEEKIPFKDRVLRVPDVVSFAYQVKEIFDNEIYRFPSSKASPLIYDCGANIGTSILYFKQLYPNSHIKAFEADKHIFSILQENIGSLPGVELHQNAVWINEDILHFHSDGADGGSLLVSTPKQTQQVKAVRLKNLLEKESSIDFLKIDIEGAEVDVLKDCAHSLKHVENIFVEYHSIWGSEQHLDQLLRTLHDNGFRYYLEAINKPHQPFMKNTTNNPMDLQINIFGVRI